MEICLPPMMAMRYEVSLPARREESYGSIKELTSFQLSESKVTASAEIEEATPVGVVQGTALGL
jgi:hypothetical protein